ncbi:hypothetical protein [Shimia aestuarii]|nr:hypothetical protein [Shimia aestuarii]
MTGSKADMQSHDLLPVGTVWVGPELNWIARMSLQSLLHAGHPVTLFHTDTIQDPKLPGLSLVPARELWDYPETLLTHVSPAVFSDFFRLHMIRKARMIWADTDVLCVRPFVPRDGYLVGYEHGGWINGAVLMLPDSSPTLNELITRFDDPSFVPDWLFHRFKGKARKAGPERALYEACRLAPNVVGPKALTHMLPKHGEDGHVLPYQILNPLPWSLADVYFNPHGGVEPWLNDQTMAVHIYTSRIRRHHKQVRPMAGSFMARFAETIGFDMDAHGPTAEHSADTA